MRLKNKQSIRVCKTHGESPVVWETEQLLQLDCGCVLDQPGDVHPIIDNMLKSIFPGVRK